MEGLKRVGRLATKYMGKQHGWGGGTLLSISSSTELAPGLEREPGQCTVLGTTRALGLAPGVARSVHTKASNEGSRIFHNHGEGRRPLLGPSPSPS